MLEPSIADELRELYAKEDEHGNFLSPAQLDVCYANFRARFSPEKLQSLDGEELLLTMHARGDKSSLVYWLEFKNDAEFQTHKFGSIGGGSSYVYGLFYSQQRQTWVTGSSNNSKEISLSEAITIARKQRDDLVSGVAVLEHFHAEPTDQAYAELQQNLERMAPSVSDYAWGHKYFSLIIQGKLDDFHNPHYQRYHLVRLLQLPPDQDGRYVCGGRFIQIAAELELPMNHLHHLLGIRNGKPRRYWRIGTTAGEGGWSEWDGMKQGSYAAIGWDALGDLSPLLANPDWSQRKTWLKQSLHQHYPANYLTEGYAGNAAGQVHAFLAEIAKGDLVLASNGGTVLGIGEVIGDYYHEVGATFPHRRSVQWLSFEQWRMNPLEHIRSTVRPLGKYSNLLEAERHIAKPSVPPPNPDPNPVLPLQGTVAQIDSVLERKGQVILYGPPGTGKTYWAETAAQEIASRAWFDKAFGELTDDEKASIMGNAVRMCCFHPAYGYEDFLEGFRPVVTDSGQMVFELRNGLFKKLCHDAAAQPHRPFFLIIDEINRGDIPRLFGELLTVMEKNKRGKFITLPLTGTTFHVPPNVFVIGTMNTADRSIALLDAALRRRFGFIELMPDSAVLGQATVGGLPLRPWLDALNARIVQYIPRDGRNLQVGHSYFLSPSGQPISEWGLFARILREDVIPLLQEYCYEDYAQLMQILGEGMVDAAGQCLREQIFAPDNADELLAALLLPNPDLSAYLSDDSEAEHADTEADDESEEAMAPELSEAEP